MKMLDDELLKDLKSRYPDITREELKVLSITEWFKCRIQFYERTIKEVKERIQMIYKEGKNWDVSEEDLEWLKAFDRELKNNLESNHKLCMLEYQHHRDGLNPPHCYEYARRTKRDIG